MLEAGFTLIRSKGSHRIYYKGNTRVVIPFHGSRILHPKIIKQVFQAIEATEESQQSIAPQEKSDRPISNPIYPLTEDVYSEEGDTSNEAIDDDE